MNPFQHMLYQVIVETFEQERLQAYTAGEKALAFKVRFDLPIPRGFYGYQHLTLILYCPTGGSSVQVWTRSTSTLAPFIDDMGTKRGNYQESSLDWVLVAHHDSCWREGVEKVLNNQRLQSLVTGGEGDKGWYNLIPYQL